METEQKYPTREEIMEFLKPRRKMRVKVIKRNYPGLVILGILLGLLLTFSCLLGVSRAGATVGEASCEIQFEQNWNQVVYTTTWSSGYPEGEYPFDFGDGSPSDVLTGTVGQKVLPHDYGWLVGDIITYTAGFTVTDGLGGFEICAQDVVIDDRPVIEPPAEEYVVFLPLIMYQVNPPSVDLFVNLGPGWNHVQIKLIWSGGNADWHQVNWGDGTTVDVYGASGDMNLVHDYPYPGGDYHLTFTVEGPGGSMQVEKDLHLSP